MVTERLQNLIEHRPAEELLLEADGLVSRFARAEYLVVERYFNLPNFRSDEKDLFWMRLQQSKEGFETTEEPQTNMGKLMMLYQNIQEEGWDGKTTYEDLMVHLQKLQEEFYHSFLFAQLAENVSGRKWQPDLRLVVGPHRQIVQLRAGMVGILPDELRQAVNGFMEVGRGAMFLAMADVKEGKLAEEINKAGQRIYQQEVGHYTRDGTEPLKKMASSITRPQWGIIFDYICQTGRIRIDMRNHQFSYPFSEEAVESLVGDVLENRLTSLSIRSDQIKRGFIFG